VIILGMVAYFSGVTQAPLTTFIIVMEMTDNHTLVLPLMATALVAHGVSRIVCHEPLYKAMAERFMLHLPKQQVDSGN
jgi:H+/Cl- antiporter ClcA